MGYEKLFPEAVPDDLCLTFGPVEPGKMPLKYAAIKTETGFEELRASMVEMGSGVLLSVQSPRCSDGELVFRPLEQRKEELEKYRKCSCVLRRNGDSNSNFWTVDYPGGAALWVHNEGSRSLSFQMPDGLFRACAGYTEKLAPSNAQAQIGPIQVLLDLGGNPLDIRVSGVHVKYGDAAWQQGGVDCQSGAHIDSYFNRVFCGDECLGILESYSDYFLENPKLEFLDIDYGSYQWYVRNKGKKPLLLAWHDGRTAEAPPDGQVYRLESLIAKEGR